MKNLIYIIVLFCFIFNCSSDNKTQENLYPDQFSGEDLFSQLSQNEKTMLGKWSWGYRYYTMHNGTDSTYYYSGMGPLSGEPLDSLKFYSTKLVGYDWDCPYDNPNKSTVKLIEARSARYFGHCFPSGVNGWLIEEGTLVYYRGYNRNDFIYYPILEINNDSIVFLYEEWPEDNSKGIDKEYAVYYKE